ncbi:MAG: glycosyltransferase [Planctomycetota bacterium]
MQDQPSGISDASRPAINIVSRLNGVGLDRDVRLLQDACASYANSCVRSRRSPHPMVDWFSRTILRSNHQLGSLNLLVERIPAAWLCASPNLLLPNQERFPRRHVSRLRRIATVLCKTRHAEEIFRQHTPNVQYLGFTSCDRLNPSLSPDYRKFLHLAGRSTLKGTQTVLDLWGANPDWPTLTLIQHPENAPTIVPDNVNLISRYLTDEELVTIQNQHGIHLCPSKSEGWGHYIAEAMSVRAVVVTTDAPPMNELVGHGRGVLVPVCASKPRKLGFSFDVDPAQLQTTIEDLQHESVEALRSIGVAAREWFLENDRQFKVRLQQAINPLRASISGANPP